MNRHHTVTIGKCATVIPGVLPSDKKKLPPYSYLAIQQGLLSSAFSGEFPSEKGEQPLLTYIAVQPGQLTADGLVGGFTTVLRDTPCSEEQFLKPGDVLIKRLNPDCAVVFEGSQAPVVASANIFIIRPKRDLDSQYLAFLLEKSKLLQRVSQLSGVGTTVAALTVAQIEGGIISLPPMRQQKILGELWTLSKKRERLLRDLSLENDRLMRALCGKQYQ